MTHGYHIINVFSIVYHKSYKQLIRPFFYRGHYGVLTAE